MPALLEILPNERDVLELQPLFPTEEAYGNFREWYVESVSDEMRRLQEARRKSEEESRQRLLR